MVHKEKRKTNKYVVFLQEVKVQELSEDVPVGHIPRSLTVQVKGDLTRSFGWVPRATYIFLPFDSEWMWFRVNDGLPGNARISPCVFHYGLNPERIITGPGILWILLEFFFQSHFLDLRWDLSYISQIRNSFRPWSWQTSRSLVRPCTRD